MEAFGAEHGFDGVEAFGGEAEAVTLRAEGDGAVGFEDEEGDAGAEEGLGEEKGGEAGAGDEDGFLLGGGGHGGGGGSGDLGWVGE